MDDPRALFDERWPRVVQAVECHGRHLKPDDLDDARQSAAVRLWVECLKPGAALKKLNTAFVALEGIRQRNGHPLKQACHGVARHRPLGDPSSETWEYDSQHPAAPTHEIRMGHGIQYTLADAAIDDPDGHAIATGNCLSAAQVAKALRLGTNRVWQIREIIGGRRLGGHDWQFPPDAAARYRRIRRPARRPARKPEACPA